MEEQKEIIESFGAKLVGLSFNPAGDPKVTKVKELIAEVIDIIGEVRRSQEMSYTKHHIFDAAIPDLIRAQMMAVKFLTFDK